MTLRLLGDIADSQDELVPKWTHFQDQAGSFPRKPPHKLACVYYVRERVCVCSVLCVYKHTTRHNSGESPPRVGEIARASQNK